MGTGKFNAGGNPAMDYLPIQGGRRNTPRVISHLYNLCLLEKMEACLIAIPVVVCLNFNISFYLFRASPL